MQIIDNLSDGKTNIENTIKKLNTASIQSPTEATDGKSPSAAALELISRFLDSIPTGELDSIKERTSETSDDYLLFVGDEIETPPCVLNIDYKREMSGCDLSSIVGLAKSRKTLFASAVANAIIKGDFGIYPNGIRERNPDDADFEPTTPPEQASVLYIDTEQSNFHAQKTIKRIFQDVPEELRNRLTYAALRNYSYKERLFITCELVYKLRPALTIIDGLADLMPDTNSNTDSPAVTALLMALSNETQTHICSILHTTGQNSTKARGHIGSELERKCETIFLVEKVEGNNLSLVKCIYSRNESFEPFTIAHAGRYGFTIAPLDTAPAIASDDKLFAEKLESYLSEHHPDKNEYPTNLIQTAIASVWKENGGGDMGKNRRGEKLNKLFELGYVTQTHKGRAFFYSFRDKLTKRIVKPDDKSGDVFSDDKQTNTCDDGHGVK